MRILLTTHQFLPDYSGGTEVLTHGVARALRRRGHDVRVLTGWPRPAPDGRRDDRYTYDDIPVYRVYPGLPADATAAARIDADIADDVALACFESLVRVWRPDVVHAIHLQRLSASIAFACVEAGIATIYTPTDFWAACPLNQLRLPDGRSCDGPDAQAVNCIAHVAVEGRRAYLAPLHRWLVPPVAIAMRALAPHVAGDRRFDAARALQRRPVAMRRMLRAFDRIGVPTRAMRARIEAAGVEPARLRLVPFGIDVDAFRDIEPIRTGPPLRLGFVGALQPHKGPQILLDAIRRLDPSSSWSLSIFGDERVDPVFAASLRRQAAGDARIAFRGTFERGDIARAYAAFDVLVVPSTWDENSPLVILAAQAARRPVVGSDVPGIADLVRDGLDGRLFPKGDSGALAGILGELVRDPARVRALATGIAPSRTVEAYVDDLVDLYRESVARRDAPDAGPSARPIAPTSRTP